jgi:threonine 3-dehydrogenase
LISNCNPFPNTTSFNLSTRYSNPPRVLITGGLGQLGYGLADLMRQKYGADNVILSDIRRPDDASVASPFMYLDVTDPSAINKVIVNEGIDWIIHFR